jgi:hypothetical protein
LKDRHAKARRMMMAIFEGRFVQGALPARNNKS